MDFTSEERKYIDWKLKMSDEMQMKNGNKTYTIEELKKEFSLIKNDERYYNRI